MLRVIRTTLIVITMLAGVMFNVAFNRASADVTGGYIDAANYNFEITHMPDLDQRRKDGPGLVGLPHSNGSFHCVPTSVMNIFAYAANHGFPTLAPGAAWWQPQSKYNDAGVAINVLGIAMFTAPGGTNTENAYYGALGWLAGSDLTVSSYSASGSFCPTINGLAESVATGAIVALCYGRYVYVGDINGTVLVGERTGGHCVTLSGATRSSSSVNITIKTRDPADDPDFVEGSDNHLFSQSLFTNKVYSSARQRTVSNLSWSRTMTALVFPPPPPAERGDPWLIRLVDSYKAVRPKQGFTWQPGINNPTIYIPAPPMGGSLQGPERAHPILSLTNMFDGGFSADLSFGFVLGSDRGGNTSLQSVNLFSGETTLIAQVTNPHAMAVGRKNEVYVLADGEIVCIDPFDPIDPFEAQVTPPGPCIAICYDDATDEVVLLSVEMQRIYRYPHRFPAGAMPTEVCIPGSVPLEPDEGEIAVNPKDGKEWFVTPASNAIYHVPPHDACNPVVQQIMMASIVNPRSVDFDDDGKLFVACDAGLMEATYNEDTGGWESAPSAYFAGAEIGPKFHVSRSRTNYDPSEHDGPAWQHVDPEEERGLPGTTLEVDCLADVVTSATFQPPPDGVVDAADLAFLLGEWGATPASGSAADIVTSATFQPPEDGVVDASDLAFMLGEWGPCE